MDEFDGVWSAIVRLEGQTFRQKRGQPFTYTVRAGSIIPSTTSRQLARSQFRSAYSRGALSGPGQLQDLQGPSYLFAILTDPRIAADMASPALVTRSQLRSPQRAVSTPRSVLAPVPPLDELLLGCSVSRRELPERGFTQLNLLVQDSVELDLGAGSNWIVVGTVPAAPGLYAFTLDHPGDETIQVVYVGMTEHLWMVTKGILPGGIARGGQRYGRPKHAGATRRRVNALATRAMSHGWTVAQWVLPYPRVTRADLLREEDLLINCWDLRTVGWNRG